MGRDEGERGRGKWGKGSEERDVRGGGDREVREGRVR